MTSNFTFSSTSGEQILRKTVTPHDLTLKWPQNSSMVSNTIRPTSFARLPSIRTRVRTSIFMPEKEKHNMCHFICKRTKLYFKTPCVSVMMKQGTKFRRISFSSNPISKFSKMSQFGFCGITF